MACVTVTPSPNNGTQPLLGNSAWIGERRINSRNEKGLRKKGVKEIKMQMR
jgi:hypothetical protein